jgi:hypothetical protein
MNSLAVAYKEDHWDDLGSDLSRFSDARMRPFNIPAPEISDRTTATPPSWFEPTLDRFLELTKLGDDWDQRGSAAPRHDVLSFALRSVLPKILLPTMPAPAVIPLGNGGVQMVWSTKNAEIEVEVVGPYSVVAYHFDKVAGTEDEEPLTLDFSSLARVMRSAY